MIYLKNIEGSQVLRIPKNGRYTLGNLTFAVKSQLTNSEFTQLVEDCEISDLYYTIELIKMNTLMHGEYEYTLTDEIGELSSGLLVIGDSETPMEYIKETTYEQYTE